MRLSERMRKFRHPMAPLLAATVVPVIILGWLGWRLIREDQELCKYGDRLLNLEIPKCYV
jgi:hypothetical protein